MLHQDKRREEAWDMAAALLDRVGIPDARKRVDAVPVRVLRRHAPARHDRHGHQLQPDDPHRRRAHDRAGRHHPGADHRGRERDAGAVRVGRHPHHARPRRRGRDRRQGDGHVRRPHRRVRPRRRDLLQPASPLHVGPARLAAAPRPGREDAAHADQGAAAGPHRAARRLPVLRAAVPTSARSAATTGPSTRSSGRPTASTAGSPSRSGSRSARSCRTSRTRSHEPARGQEPEEVLPHQDRCAQAHHRPGVRGRRHQLLGRARARRSAWSARAAAASRRRAAPCCASSSPRRATSRSTTSTS